MGQIQNKDLLHKVARRVKTLREKHGVTQEVFYFDTNIHIGRIETARVNITISTLDAICQYFGTNLEEFFRGFEIAEKDE
ncbi:helix-turn-helix transcriptional regulator [Runella sp.]|uniref:helix-turn-helix domain-containing protein n=1 Tax=Runella sp. TaxID=1960881 RepID=UPI00301A644E